jgi:hypothetical protein
MNTKIIGWLSLSFITFLIMFILVSILFIGHPENPETVEQLVNNGDAHIKSYSINFVFHIFFSVLLTFLFLSIYLFCKTKNPVLATLGFVSLPAYLVLSNFFSSVRVIFMPQLFRLYDIPEYKDSISMILKQFLPGSEGTAIGGIANLPYVFLGFSALLFGWILSRETKILKIAGYLIMLNGIGYLAGLFDIFMDSKIISILNGVGGISFLIALILFCVVFLFKRGKNSVASEPVLAQN